MDADLVNHLQQRCQIYIVAFQEFLRSYYGNGCMSRIDIPYGAQRLAKEDSPIYALALARASQAVRAFDAQFPL